MLNSVSNGDSIKELDNLIRLFRFCKPLSEKVWEFLKNFFSPSFFRKDSRKEHSGVQNLLAEETAHSDSMVCMELCTMRGKPPEPRDPAEYAGRFHPEFYDCEMRLTSRFGRKRTASPGAPGRNPERGRKTLPLRRKPPSSPPSECTRGTEHARRTAISFPSGEPLSGKQLPGQDPYHSGRKPSGGELEGRSRGTCRR